MNNEKKFTLTDLRNVFIVIGSSLLYSAAMNTFVNAGNLFPGGFSGISRLTVVALQHFFGIEIPFGAIFFTLNVIVSFIVYKKIGHKFALLSMLWFTLTSVLTSILPLYQITSDPLLISVFGGLMGGFAIALTLRNNASSGGTDFIAIYFSMRYNVQTWNYVLGFNAVILFIAGLLVGWDKALYSIIYQFVSTQIVSALHKRYKLTRIEVVTSKPDEVCDAIFKTCHHGITKVPCEGGFTNQPHWLLILTINTYQLKDVIDCIKAADNHVFMTINNVDRIVGNYYQKPLD